MTSPKNIYLLQDEWNVFMLTKTRAMALELKEDSETYSEDLKEGVRVTN